MLSVGFEPTIPALEQAKTVHALDRAATVIGLCQSWAQIIFSPVLSYTFNLNSPSRSSERERQSLVRLVVTTVWEKPTAFIFWVGEFL
jgi:hypothetical protein